MVTAPVTAGQRDVRALARIISEDRADLPADVGLPPSLLADLMGQIRCDVIAFAGIDSGRQKTWFLQAVQKRSSCSPSRALARPAVSIWNL
jgi:hypothetical protein